MPDYTPNARPLCRTGTPTTVCRCCGDTMNHFPTIAKLGVLINSTCSSALRAKGVDTKELKQVA